SNSDVARFERRGVKVINLPGNRDHYGEILAAAFIELRNYIRENLIGVSKVTEEGPLRELLLPRDAASRLCFFSLPLDLLPFYRERVFPVVEEAGFVPVTADDVVTPGESISAKLDSLIDRASVMIIELSTSWTRAEFRMALARLKAVEANSARRKRLQLIIVTTHLEQIPLAAHEFLIIPRPDEIADSADEFVLQLGQHLQAVAAEIGIEGVGEPKRLFEAKEYRAAVISAVSLLEARLRAQLHKRQWTDVQRPMSLHSLVKLAVLQGLVRESRTQKL